jgi:extracellular elastinolytic metalloproteinase
MGEGWGDFWATALRMRKEYTHDQEFGMGNYSAGRGIRPFAYSTSMKTNPHTYSWIKKSGYGGVHAMGAVWASILYDVYWAFVDKYGFNPDWYSVTADRAAGKSLAGNIKIMQLVVDGLKLQPCRPTFIDARDAILKADEVSFGGEDTCLLWRAYAKRGLGFSAKKGGIESFDLPVECQ